MANVATWNEYTLGVVLDTVVGKNLRIFPIMYKQFKHIAYCFFDIKQLSGENPGLTVAPKDIPGIEPSITVDGYSIKWLDYNTFDFSTEVDANASVTVGTEVSITLKDTSGLAVNDTIYFKTNGVDGDDVDGTVTEVTSATAIKVMPTSVNGAASGNGALKKGQDAVRGYWTRNDNDEIIRPASVYSYVEFQSYIQHFSRRITFTKAELNKIYKYEGDAKAEATKRLNYNIGIMFQEINKAIYKGRNVAPGATQKMEMLGLEEINRQKGTIVDLASAGFGWAAAPATGSEMLDNFYRIIEECQLSGSVASNDTITLLVNDKFLTELGRFREEKIRYDRVVDKLDMVLPTLATVYGDVELVRDPMLNTLYNYSVAFTLPKALVKLWTRENQEFNPKGGVTRADQSIHFYDVINNLREQKSYDMVWECGLIAGGMSAKQSPYYMIKNFVHMDDVVKTKEVQ